MEKLKELKKTLTKTAKKQVPIQCEWVEVKAVDWDEKTMTGIGTANDLDYDDVLLGLGHIYTKPKIGCLALVGSINNSAACIMIDCEEIEELLIEDKTAFKWHLKDGKLTVNGENFGGIVKAPELKTQVDKNTEVLKKIQEAFTNWAVIPEDGGAALKGLSGNFTSLQVANLENIENETIKHGNG